MDGTVTVKTSISSEVTLITTSIINNGGYQWKVIQSHRWKDLWHNVCNLSAKSVGLGALKHLILWYMQALWWSHFDVRDRHCDCYDNKVSKNTYLWCSVLWKNARYLLHRQVIIIQMVLSRLDKSSNLCILLSCLRHVSYLLHKSTLLYDSHLEAHKWIYLSPLLHRMYQHQFHARLRWRRLWFERKWLKITIHWLYI